VGGVMPRLVRIVENPKELKKLLFFHQRINIFIARAGTAPHRTGCRYHTDLCREGVADRDTMTL
jgi:hypothetical protein